MSVDPDDKPIIVGFKTRKKNSSGQSEPATKLEAAWNMLIDEELRFRQINETSAFRLMFRKKVPEVQIVMDQERVYNVPATGSSVGEMKITKIDLSTSSSFERMESTESEKEVWIEKADIVTIIENSEDDTKDNQVWKYLTRRRETSERRFSLMHYSDYNRSKILGRRACTVSCPNCTFSVLTKKAHVRSIRTSRSASFMAILGLCCVPFILPIFQDVVHICPYCGIYLGCCPAFKYPYSSELMVDLIPPISSYSSKLFRRGGKTTEVQPWTTAF